MTLVLEREDTDTAVVESFAIAPRAKESLPLFRGRCTVVRLASIDNDVLGVPRWSTFAEIWGEPGSARTLRWVDNPVVTVGPHDDPDLVLATRTPVVVVGIDNERTAYARVVIDAIRASCNSVLVVDMGHRLTGHSYADVATFGFDRDRGAALIRLLTAR
ncbi:hypothetical protein [Leifsonia poae]|uniref:Uncharacterized protein n=1 Tax=Leifsonia poae TaxID=110933 RepID=A0A9W6HD35_9MICO|nr:hypothetical protein [Leifsonia poae]GLJ77558.1 hypothetical protein GCM10017584_31320 [Leifsonia poae]